MEFKCVKILELLLISNILFKYSNSSLYQYHSYKSPNSTSIYHYRALNEKVNYDKLIHNTKRSDISLEKQNSWKGWNFGNELSEPDSIPEEKLIKFEVLDDAPNEDNRPNSQKHDYWNDIFWPNRYASKFDRNESWTVKPYGPIPESPPKPSYHWQNLRPIGQYQPTSSVAANSSLNFGFGGISAAAGSSASISGGYVKPTLKPLSLIGSSSSQFHQIGPLPFQTTDRSTGNRKHYTSKTEPYKRKRYRLEIHPGLIAAPIAGLFAYGAVSHFTSNPVLLEWGLVKPNGEKEHVESPPKPQIPQHHHHHHHYVPTTTNRPYHNHHHEYYPNTPTEIPILLPPHLPDKPWWSSFAAIIPRIRMGSNDTYLE